MLVLSLIYTLQYKNFPFHLCFTFDLVGSVITENLLEHEKMNKEIRLTSVSHEFLLAQQKVSLFNDLSFSLSQGSSASIVGPSGAGKSSLLLLLAGLEQAAKGSVEFLLDGQPSTLAHLKQESGFIFQQFHLLPELDALTNVALPLRLKGEKGAKERARDWLARVGLKNRLNHKPTQLSGGEQQRVAIARAFVGEPSFIFADEPTGNLDESTAAEISELMFGCVRENNTGLVMVTHNRNIAALADQSYLLLQGRLQQVSGYQENVA